MLMAITPELVEGTFMTSIWVLGVTYVILIAFNVYVLYLNWKQSKVKDQMIELIKEVKEIKEILRKNKKKL